VSDDQRLGRIERLLTRTLVHVVRLESRLEHAGLLPGDQKADDALRYALENDMEVNLDPVDPDEHVTLEYQKRVADYLETHWDDADASFYKMEDDFGAMKSHEHRVRLMRCLELFVLRGQFDDLIERMTTGMDSPSETHGIHRNPYRDEFPTRARSTN
jgi:hypothetical protein